VSREVRRVPLDFAWPLKKVWEGYLMPDRLQGAECHHCGASGFGPEARYLYDNFYEHSSHRRVPTFASGWVPPSWARQIGWNADITDEEVDFLQSKKRLCEFNRETREWEARTVTANEVNEANRRGGFLHPYGHDGVNHCLLTQFRADKAGVPLLCGPCGGHGSVEKYPGQRADAEAWKATDPPTGEGWQFWETVSEGSPVSPVFATADDLVTWLVEYKDYRLSAAQQIVSDGYTVGSFMMIPMEGKPVMLDSARDSDIIDAINQED